MTGEPLTESEHLGPDAHFRRAEILLASCQIASEGEEGPSGEVCEYYGAASDSDGVDDCRNALLAALTHAVLALAGSFRVGGA